MNWSMNVKKILTIWADACIENSGTANSWYVGNKEYAWETSPKEYADGSVAGTVFRMDGFKKASSSFRIDGDGLVVRAPSFLRKASGRVEEEMAIEASKARIHKRENSDDV